MDFFGGTKGDAMAKEYEKHRMDLMSDQSDATREYHSKRRMKLTDVAKEIDSLNEKK